MDLSSSGIGARALRTRWFVRAPIPLYRHGFGWLFGSRILMLEHTGRTSGQPRFVCLEVVEHPAPRRYVIVSGFGEQAQWYRNLAADPHCFVSVGRVRRGPATARFMTGEQSAAVLGRYQQVRPRQWDTLRSTIEKATGAPVETLPMVELTLT